MPCIIDTNGRWLSNWPFVGDNGETITRFGHRPIEVNSPMAARAAAVSGLGWAVLPDFIAEPDIEAGRLVPVLDDRMPKGGGIFAVYPHRRYLPAKVRVLRRFPGAVVQGARTAEAPTEILRRRGARLASQFRPLCGKARRRIRGDRGNAGERCATPGTAHGGRVCGLLASTVPASVHPHVFAEARLDVVVNPDQTVKSLRHLWRFDDLFSSHRADGVRQEHRPEARRRRTAGRVEDGLRSRLPSTIISRSSPPTARTWR